MDSTTHAAGTATFSCLLGEPCCPFTFFKDLDDATAAQLHEVDDLARPLPPALSSPRSPGLALTADVGVMWSIFNYSNSIKN